MRHLILPLVLLALACSPASTPTPQPAAAPAPARGSEATPPEPIEPPTAQPEPEAEVEETAIPTALVRLYPDDEAERARAWVACRDGADERARVRCLLALRYADHNEAAQVALDLYETQGTVAGLERSHSREVGWRGVIEFVPELPVGEHREQLVWVAEGLADIDRFFALLSEHADDPIRYRHKPLMLRFFRSVDRTTPSAWASRWNVGWNVVGSLHTSARKVRETLFHEIYHLNDPGWSEPELSELVADIIERCTRRERLSTSCLKPYAPGTTRVKGSTYYAFHPGNGVGEYAAELALRYYQEQRAVLLELKDRPEPFKCQTEENALAWGLLRDRFFGGVDLTPPCS